MKVSFYSETLPGSCGVEILYDFKTPQYSTSNELKSHITQGGAGFICAGFIENHEYSDEMFQQMSDKYDVLFVSPVRLNRNSENQFYFAVFSVKDVEDDLYGYDDSNDQDND